MSEEKRKVDVAEVLDLLKQGKSRKEIAEYYGLPMSVMSKTVWQHPDLKNRKAKKQYGIELFDSRAEEEQQETSNQVDLEDSIAEIEAEQASQSTSDVSQEAAEYKEKAEWS